MLIWDRQELEILRYLSRWPDSNLSFSDIYTHPTFLQDSFPFPKYTFTFPLQGFAHTASSGWTIVLPSRFISYISVSSKPSSWVTFFKTCQTFQPIASSILCPSTVCHSLWAMNTFIIKAALCQALCQTQSQVCMFLHVYT